MEFNNFDIVDILNANYKKYLTKKFTRGIFEDLMETLKYIID